MLKQVGLIGPPSREEIERLAIRLEERGADAVILDPREDPEILVGPAGETACGADLSELRSVYVADLGLPSSLVTRPGGEVDPPASARALERSRRLLVAWDVLLNRLSRRIPVVNPPRSYTLHENKPYETSAYAAAGYPVPATVATTDPSALAELPGGADVSWIRKGMVGGYTHTEAMAAPATRGEAKKLLEGSPLMAQERIDGDNVRAYVLDGSCIGAAEVIPVKGSETDSRRGDARVRRIELTAEQAGLAASVAGRWGMIFAAVDFMRDSRTGRMFVLECNSAPFFVGFEARTGIDVSGRLAGFLVRDRRR